MEKSERQASDGEEQEKGKRWGRARDRHANDGEERETDRRVMGKSERDRQVIENIEQETE